MTEKERKAKQVFRAMGQTYSCECRVIYYRYKGKNNRLKGMVYSRACRHVAQWERLNTENGPHQHETRHKKYWGLSRTPETVNPRYVCTMHRHRRYAKEAFCQV